MGGTTQCRETQTGRERKKGKSSKKEENFRYDLITNLLAWSLTFQKCTSNKIANLVFMVNNVFFFPKSIMQATLSTAETVWRRTIKTPTKKTSTSARKAWGRHGGLETKMLGNNVGKLRKYNNINVKIS